MKQRMAVLGPREDGEWSERVVKACFEFGPLVVWTLMLFTVVRPLRLSRWGNVLLGALLLVASQKFLIYRMFGGDSFVPDLPERFVNFTGWSYSATMILFGLSCVWGGIAKFWRYFRPVGCTCARVVLPGLAVVALAVSGWGVWEGVRVPDVQRIEIPVRGLPEAFDGFRLVQLTDLHCSPAARKARTAGIVAKVNDLQPDLVCITGDFVDGSPEQRADDLSPLADLRAQYGVFGCAGNHEYYSDYLVWRPLYESFGIRMLDNAHHVLERGGARIALGGVTDPAVTHNKGKAGPGGHSTVTLETPNVKKAFAGVPQGLFRILLQHRPIIPQMNEAMGIDLQLSGHTHGGAIRGFDYIVAHMGNHGFVRGFYQVGRMALYVSPGTGQWAGFPLRLGVPAEITEIVLRRAP